MKLSILAAFLFINFASANDVTTAGNENCHIYSVYECENAPWDNCYEGGRYETHYYLSGAGDKDLGPFRSIDEADEVRRNNSSCF